MVFADEKEPDDVEEGGEGEGKAVGRPWIWAAFAIIIALLGLMFYGSIREFSMNSVPTGPQYEN